MTKVTIIPIDLNFNVDAIISENVQEITGKAREELDVAIASAKHRDAVREKRQSSKQIATAGIDTALRSAFDQLVAAGSTGVACDVIIQDVSTHIATASAFTTRMKTYLRKMGNPYRLERVKAGKNNYYILQPYNMEAGEPGDAESDGVGDTQLVADATN